MILLWCPVRVTILVSIMVFIRCTLSFENFHTQDTGLIVNIICSFCSFLSSKGIPSASSELSILFVHMIIHKNDTRMMKYFQAGQLQSNIQTKISHSTIK